MRIVHASDLHGDYRILGKAPHEFDVWAITGDFFPNYGRGSKTGGLIDPDYERSTQLRWWGWKGGSVMRRLRDRPVMWMAGNHDFISLAQMLKGSDYQGPVFDVTTAVDFEGQRFAGYREIPRIVGEWPGEVDDFSDIVKKTMEKDPTILLTHTPPGGILDDDREGAMGHGVGVTAQSLWFAYRPHRVTHHFFGHIHAQGGKRAQEMGVIFINSATTLQVVEVCNVTCTS